MKKSIFPFFLLMTFSVLLFSCSASEWDKQDKDALLDRCMQEGGKKSYCKCYLKNAMEKFPIAKDMDDIDFETAVELSIDCE